MKCAVSLISVIFLVVTVSLLAIYILRNSGECKNNVFVCVEDDTCIPFSKLCDGKSDCPNGTDEYPHECADLTNLKELLPPMPPASNGTSSNGSAECLLDENSIPQKCKCKPPLGIGCENLLWPRIPWEDFHVDITRLILNNVLDQDGNYGWKNDTLSPQNIKILFLENHPHGENFPWDFLRRNSGMKRLYLTNNGLTSLPNKIFSKMVNLIWLDLQWNSLEYIDKDTLSYLPSLRWLDLSYNNLDLKGYKFHDLPELFDLVIKNNKMTEIGPQLFRDLRNIKLLDLRRNGIESIHERAFRYNTKLKNLDLGQNKLHSMNDETFVGVRVLTKLNIGKNPLKWFSTKVFCNLTLLESLNVDGLEIEQIELDVFNCFQRLTYVHFKKFQFCRYAAKVPKCFPNSDGLSSTANLLVGTALRLIIWVVAILTVLGNITVLFGRWWSSRQSRILDIFINNLAGADMLTGFYLITLAIKDITLRNSYNLHAYEWSTSWLCSTVGVLAMISCEVSLLILTIMSLERYLVISGPFSAPKLSRSLAHLSMFIIWVFVIVLAITPLFQWRGKSSFYGSTGLCFPLHLDDPFSVGWEYSAFVFIGLNSVCLILIAISYGKLFWVIRQTRLSTPIFIRDMEMALRFFLMVVSDFICWVPIILFKVAVLHGYQIPQDIHAWLLIFVLPLNSAVNPFLYTFSTGSIRLKLKFVQNFLTSLTRVHQTYRGSFENHTLRNLGTTTDTPLCNSMLAKRKEDTGICSLTHQDSVTSK